MWKNIVFKVGQVFGIGATAFIAFLLLMHPHYEPRTWLRTIEIVGSIAAAVILAIDFLDFAPWAD